MRYKTIGRLSQTPDFTGFVGLDLCGAVAGTAGTPRVTPLPLALVSHSNNAQDLFYGDLVPHIQGIIYA